MKEEKKSKESMGTQPAPQMGQMPEMGQVPQMGYMPEMPQMPPMMQMPPMYMMPPMHMMPQMQPMPQAPMICCPMLMNKQCPLLHGYGMYGQNMPDMNSMTPMTGSSYMNPYMFNPGMGTQY